HLIAANIDQVIITVSVVDPPLRPSIIDRYLIAAEKGGLKAIIVCNKMDLLDDAHEVERILADECRDIYRTIGVPFLQTSITSGEGLQSLIDIMKDRTSVFSGQSGAGKSSLLNVICGFNLKVGKTVASTKKGAHTTSWAELLPLPFGGYVVDTPGIKSFGIWDVTKEDIRNYFTEIADHSRFCKFQDCSHRQEPGCSIPEAVEKGIISELRYNSYLNLLESIEEEHLRR
ncbi:MAG TPA: ribosome small subunit-dependent GTPase A, partial [Chlamydiales bacterium]|nr:ribosome small subunit-dependent GTPase A [Chlamydiales bacterium]